MPGQRSEPASEDPRRRTPSTDAVLRDSELGPALDRLGRGVVKGVVVAVVAECRAGLLSPGDVVATVLHRLPESATTLRTVLNATGVLVHTNLGRAPLSPAAVTALAAAAGATDVELDLVTGRRSRRGAEAMAALARAVPDAEAVHVVNNGAAALALTACALAGGREIIVARGELVEIGDGFRIPELMESVGARLREVGSTNRVRLADYAAAVGSATGFVLKVHPSNFKVEGFTSSVGVRELATLGVPVVADIGSGLLERHPRLPDEPDARTYLRDGAALVIASGDKLLGGPQCGLLLGQADLVQGLSRHPLARGLRVDKLTLAALEATLEGPVPPVAAALATSPAELLTRARKISARIGPPAVAERSTGAVGGGGAPGVVLESAAVVLPQHLVDRLRRGSPPVVGHVSGGRLLLDLLAVPVERDADLAAAVLRALAAEA